MGQAAADRAAVPDCGVRHQRECLRHDRAALADQGGSLERGLAGERPDGEAAVGPRLDVVELAQRVEVDQQLGARQPQVHQRDQALPAGYRLPVVGLAQGGDRVADVDRTVVVERSWLHSPRSFRAAVTAATLSKIICGVIGTSVIRMPNGVRASSTALAIAAGVVMYAPSAVPLAP